MSKEVLAATIIGISMIVSVTIWKGLDYLETKQAIAQINNNLKTFKLPKTVIKSQAKYKKVWINGRSLDECMVGHNELNATVSRCREGYFDTIKIQ